ncbi:hypothetical protein [Dysgonomonas sp. 511]|uniref:hypothetical protein n=1 Tax=Dysgonomonas sp. 511 TaxID=2302930 RepID=UPI0013D87C6E|nr:hypothetical protein [Dysgonomonas sp. 511]NDV79999.1 hypothetical protein [Dysgonomonas sp. 511]
MAKKNTEANTSFFSFIKAKEQWIDWIILAVSCLIGYIALKICYPFPATISDSGTYVSAAVDDMFTFYRPFGYSAFLQIVHTFSSSVHAIFVSQIVLYFVSCAAFALVVKYIYTPANRILWYILLFIFVFSPISFYMSNAIMSDMLFAIMIYFMLAALFYLIKAKNSWVALGVLLLALYFCLQIRYLAIIFPVMFIACFFLLKGKMRWIGIAGIMVVTFAFYNQVKSDMKKTTGFNQFSTGFDGWQLANNAMHIIPYIDLKPERIANNELAGLHSFVVVQKDAISERTKQGADVSASFMWINDLPLKQYLFAYIQHTKQPYPIAWVRLGNTTYKDYGQYLIKRYPLEFVRYYYLPNARSIFYTTSKEIIGGYTPINVDDIFEWYKIPKETAMDAKYDIYKDFLAEASSVSYLILWPLIFVLGIFSFLKRKKLVWFDQAQKQIFWIIIITALFYYGATVFASPVSLRFWLPMNAIIFSLVYIMSNRLFERDKQ